MWPFSSRKSLSASGFFEGYVDYHSHLLPGVDDGVRTPEETLEILHLYSSLGVGQVYLTPHVMEDMPNSPAELKRSFEHLLSSYAGTPGGGIRLHLAAENMLDSLFEERLERGDLLTLGAGGGHLLVETSYFTPPMNFHALLERVKSQGYFPVLAHPERYIYMDRDDYSRLKEMGVLFQLNYYSAVGIYGPEAKEKAEWLLAHDYYDLSGSDTHRLRILREAVHARTLSSSTLSRMLDLARREL